MTDSQVFAGFEDLNKKNKQTKTHPHQIKIQNAFRTGLTTWPSRGRTVEVMQASTAFVTRMPLWTYLDIGWSPVRLIHWQCSWAVNLPSGCKLMPVLLYPTDHTARAHTLSHTHTPESDLFDLVNGQKGNSWWTTDLALSMPQTCQP